MILRGCGVKIGPFQIRLRGLRGSFSPSSPTAFFQNFLGWISTPQTPQQIRNCEIDPREISDRGFCPASPWPVKTNLEPIDYLLGKQAHKSGRN